MTRKPASLTAHKNTVEKHRKSAIKAELVTCAKEISQENVVAYAIVAIQDDGSMLARWDTGGIMPMLAFPSTVERCLAYDIGTSGVEEDWKPSLEQFRGPKRGTET